MFNVLKISLVINSEKYRFRVWHRSTKLAF